MKKTIILLIFIAVLVSFFMIPAQGETYCPINYSCYITHDDSGIPTIHFDFINTSESKIVYIEYSASLYDRDYSPAYDQTGTSSVCRVKISNLSVDSGFNTGYIGTNLSVFPTSAHVGEIKSLLVRFEDGTIWEKHGVPVSKANFFCRNEYNNGIFSADDGKIYLCDTSTFSQTREWYYWDDAKMTWVHFGNGLYVTMPARGYETCIKLVINGNTDMYCIKTLNIKTTSIAATCRESRETLYSTEEFMTFNTKELDPPFEISLWDYCDSNSEKWYIWSDITMKWQPFSNEKGTDITVYDKSSLCLKTVYNDDINDYKIFNIYFR